MAKILMENVHFVSEDDDIYSGYNDYDPSLAIEDIQQDVGFQQAIKTSYGRRPLVATRMTGTGQGLATSRLSTAFAPGSEGTPQLSKSQARPMTAVRGAGYSSMGSRGSGKSGSVFDPLHQSRSTMSPLQPTKEETSQEEKLKALEKLITNLMEESCFAAERGENKQALEKAKEAVTKEKSLTRQREQNEISPNLDLSYSVLFNLAIQYTANEMYSEAMSTYQQIVKNRSFSHTGRLKVNMGNICFKQGNYPKAIKFYRMALDQVPNIHKDIRIKIMKNIGLAFVKLGQLTDAVTSFEYMMSERGDLRTALHLTLCHSALGDKDKMRRSFLKLLESGTNDELATTSDEDKYLLSTDDPHSALILEAIKNDSLRKIERKRKQEADWCILTAAKIISPLIYNSFAEGYDWCVQQIKTSSYSELANDLEINKAVMYLRKREFNQAIETLKQFEKRETKVASTASTNLSFLYILQGELALAEKYADSAILADHYNAGALVNKGNCCFLRGDYEKAEQYYREALVNESSCIEALYNLGLTYKKQNNHDKALENLFKLQTIIRNHPQVLTQIANIYEMLEETDQAMEWYHQIAALVGSDPNLLDKIGDMWEKMGDKQQAFHCYSDSYRFFPSNIEVIEKLGAYHVDSGMYEKAIAFFEKAAIIQPREIKWSLLAASCYRRAGNYPQALNTYRDAHRRFPDNVDCLRFLIRLCSDLNLPDAAEFQQKLKKVEKAKELKEQRAASSGSRPGSRRSSSRLSRDGSASSHTSIAGATASPKTPLTPAHNISATVLEEEPLFAKLAPAAPAYEDPIGAMEERPKTSRRREGHEDEFADEELGDDLLPE